jgi:hypothetical protein
MLSSERNWTREWRVFIWSWAIDWSDDEWLVETIQHRFLGEEQIHHYSSLIWQIGVVACAASAVILSVFYAWVVAFWSDADPSIVGLLSLLVLPLVAFACVIVYFTYIPPK